MRELTPDPFPYSFYVDYLNTPEVQAAIGAYQNFSESSNAVSQAFTYTGDDNRESGTIEAIRSLLEQGVTVMLYAGDADYNCNWLGGEAVAYEIGAEGFSCAGYTNLSTSDGIVHGQVKQAGAFSFVRIYESGFVLLWCTSLINSTDLNSRHEVPFYSPVAALEIFDRAINGKDIATGTVTPSSSYLTEGTKDSEYREGNSTIQFEVLPANATYNTTTNAPNVVKRANLGEAVGRMAKMDPKRGVRGMLSSGKKFKP